MAKVEDYELEEQYKEMLDEVYGTVSVAGYEHDTSRLLQEIDPIAYRVGFNDWLDTLDNCEDCDRNPTECMCEACGACGEWYNGEHNCSEEVSA